MASNPQAIQEYLFQHERAMTGLLTELVAIESPSDVPKSQQAILDLLTEHLRALDYRVRRIPGRESGGHLFARPGWRARRTPLQLLLGHSDTVWPIGTLRTMPITIREGTMRGPGVYDMKAGLVQMLFAAQALEALNLRPAVAPVLFVNSDEEIGSRESSRYVHALARRVDRALVMEPSLGPSGELKTARKGVGRFTIKVTGKAAHAGLDPHAGASAILELSHVIQKLFALNDPQAGVSVNVGMVDGGVRANVVAPESSAIVDVRVATRRDAERIEAAIHGLEAETAGVSVSVTGRVGRPPMERTAPNQRLWAMARELGSQLALDLNEGTAGGGSDGNTTSLYTATLDGLGGVGDGAHAAHEFIYLEHLPKRTALLAMLMLAPPLTNRPEEMQP